MAIKNKIFRVFVSSTFTDMREERRILQEDVFPRLKELCARKGASFQDVDLRWGVNEESQLDQKTVDICLSEIARCQRLSPKPNFIVLLGDKYGWQPIPSRIPTNEMEIIFGELNEDEKTIITQWYREDQNAVPPEFVLQPRQGKYLEYANWADEESRIRDILRKAVGNLNFTEAQRIKYFASATHQEILSGALNPAPGVINPKEHVFAYLRTIKKLPEDESAEEYIDIDNGRRDEYSKEQLKRLEQILKVKLPPEHVFPYEANWSKGCVLTDKNAFAERVFNDLSEIINAQLEEVIEDDPLKNEIKYHKEFIKQGLAHFTGREDALKSIRDYINSNKRKVFSIIGSPGTGKTSLVAKAIEESNVWPGEKVYRFIGTTSNTSNTYGMLSNLINEIASLYNIEMYDLLKEGEEESRISSLQGMQDIFLRSLSLATKEKPLLIFLDALDQLNQDISDLNLNWIPDELAENVKIVVSALPELKEKLRQTDIYTLGPMPEREGKELLNRWMSSINRTLQPFQEKEVLEKFAENGTPLYLKLVFETVKSWYSYSNEVSLSSDTESILDKFFNRLEKEHGRILIEKVCGYLLSGKYQGLMEEEILDLLVFDKEHWKYFIDHCHPDHRQEVEQMVKLPLVVWSRLFLDLEPYLTEREADNFPIITFYHRKFADYVRENYIANSSKEFHSILTDYFEEESLYHDEKEHMPNIRKVAEQPYHETLAGQWDDLSDKSLANFPFLMAKTKANMVEVILDDYQFVFQHSREDTKNNFPGMNDINRSLLSKFQRFITAQSHILTERPGMLFQQAVNEPDDSPVAQRAHIELRTRHQSHPWLRWANRPQILSACVLTLAGHNDSVTACSVSSDGRHIASCSTDGTARIWDAGTGKELFVVSGTGNLWTCAFSPDGKWLAVGGDSYTAICDIQTGIVSEWPNTKGRTVRCCAFSNDGDRIVYGDDSGLLELSDPETGKTLASLQGHNAPVKRCRFTHDGRRIISGDLSKVLGVWDTCKAPVLQVLHTDVGWSGMGWDLMPDGELLIWCFFDDNHWGWEVWDIERARVIKKRSAPMMDLFVSSPDGMTIAATSNEIVKLVNPKTGITRLKLGEHRDNIRALAFSTDSKRLVSADDTGTINVWDLAVDEAELEKFSEGHYTSVSACVYSPDGRYLVTGSHRELRLWNRDILNCMMHWEQMDGTINSCSFSPNGQSVASVAFHHLRVLTIYSPIFGITESPVEEWTLEVSENLHVCVFSPDGRNILITGADGKLRIIDTHTLTENWVFQKSGGCIGLFTPDGKYILTDSEFGWLILLDAETGEERNTYFGEVQSGKIYEFGKNPEVDNGGGQACALSPDGNRCLVIGSCRVEDDMLFLFDLTDANQIQIWHSEEWPEGMTVCGFSPDGKHMSLGTEDGWLCIFDAATFEKICWYWIGLPVTSHAWHPGGTELVVCDTSGRILRLLLENLESGPPILTPWRSVSEENLAIGCPFCYSWSTILPDAVGSYTICPTCRSSIKLNSFFIDADWQTIAGAWAAMAGNDT